MTTCNLEERIYSDYIRRYLFREEYILDILGFWDSISSLHTWNHKLRLVFWPFRSRSKQCAELLDDLQSYPQKVSETATDASSDRVKYLGFRNHASVVRGYKEMNSCDLIYNRQFSSLPRPSEMNEKNVSTYDTKPC